MFRIDDGDNVAVSPFPLPAVTGTEGYFTEGNPATGVAATRVTDEWLNSVQEEIAHAIEALGGTIDKTDANQLGDLLAAQGSNVVKSHLTDTGNVTTAHLRGVFAATASRASGADSASIASNGGAAGGVNSAVIACLADLGVAVASGAQSALIASKDSTVTASEAAAIASVNAGLVGGSKVAAIASEGADLAGTGAGSTESAVIGGTNNTIDSQTDAVIAGGTNNVLNNNRTFIGGGDGNTIISSNAAVLGGSQNQASGIGSGIVGAYNSDIDAAFRSAVVGCDGAIIYAPAGESNIVMLASKNAQAKDEAFSVQGGYSASAITKDTTGAVYNQNVSWRIHSNGGTLHATNTTVQSLDYAERFEFAEHCAPGMIVAREGVKVRPARPGDRTFGVLSANPGVIGDAGDLHWHGKYAKDEFGGFVMETLEMVRYPGYDGKLSDHRGTPPPDTERYQVTTRKLSASYDPKRAYVNRAKRADWGAVGFLGQIFVRVATDVRPDDDITPGLGGVGVKGKGKGRTIEVMAITSPFDRAKGYAVALCMVG